MLSFLIAAKPNILIYMNLQKIKFFCESKQIALKHLAEKVGSSEANLHRCIRLNKIQADVLERIALELRVSVVEFFDAESGSERNEATASGAGSGATNHGNIRIINQASPPACVPMECADVDDARVLKERIRGLEARLKDKQDMIDFLKSRQ